MNIRTWSAWTLLFVAMAAGCNPSGGARVEPPSWSPAAAARDALALYDTNKDGVLDAAELEKCPVLKVNLSRYDANGDGKLSADEIAARLQVLRDSKIGRVAAPVVVTLNGRPLANAKVTFIPEPFLGPAFKPASGVSDASGGVTVQIENDPVPGVPCGLYRVEVSLADAAGRETIPARYNAQTTLGCEIGPSTVGGRGGLEFKLTTR
jgi:hypothetical protein